jgi:DNA-directed RNA polymerase subunit alpha
MLNFRKLSFNTNTTNITSQHAVIKVSNLEAGFGITLGNSLRRTMLLSTPGVALFAVKITDVNHEYQAIKGIEEDAMQLISNLKNLVIKINNSVYSAEDLESAKIES